MNDASGQATIATHRSTKWRVDSFLDVVIAQSATVLKLFAGKDEGLLKTSYPSLS
jgi:hypothetical protein